MVLGKTEDEQESALKVMKAVFALLDKIPKLKLSDSFRKKALNSRKGAETEKAKEENEKAEQEALEKKRREQIEYNQKLKSLPPEQQKKMEEKRRKKELEQQKKKMMKVVKH